MSDRVLVVDDERVLRENLVRFLTHRGLVAEAAADGHAALAALDAHDHAVVITDLNMPGMGGAELMAQINARFPGTLVLVVTAYASVESAIAALRAGAQDYLLKPLSLDEVATKVERLLHTRAVEQRAQRLRQELHQHLDTAGWVAESPAMQPVLRLVDKAAQSRSTVLIEGESGTGKELVARALHERSPWKDKDFIPVNLAAQPRDLVDATLFGHERGAYTGAARRRDGVFRAVRGGTVFLDEVGELPAEVQVKLLRVLENREVQPLGADRPEPVDFRLVAATNRPLADAVSAGTFREDLYFRLEILRILLPPLRDRREDIGPLAHRLLQRHAAAQHRPAPQLTRAAIQKLEGHTWPGNVRELSNAVERALLLSEGPWIDADDIATPGTRLGTHAFPADLKEALSMFERDHVQRILDQCGGDKPAAADRLGVHLATLYRHLDRLGLRGS